MYILIYYDIFMHIESKEHLK